MSDGVRFLCDQMLGSLARWLRFLGYDALYPGVEDDTELLRLAKKECRLLLTRDRELAERAGAGGVLIRSVELDGQILQLKAGLGLDLRTGQRMLRCPRCNSILAEAPKEDVQRIARERICGGQQAARQQGSRETGTDGKCREAAQEIPEGVLERQERFWQCPGCGQVYWPGSHYERIMEKIGELEKGSRQRAAGSRD
jgi:uncharacterized protein with PIN domain